MAKYVLTNYFDVWGNDEDGWEVNDACEVGTFECEGTSDEDMLDSLKYVAKFLQPHVSLDDVYFEDWGTFEDVDLYRKSDHKPMARLTFI